jgi:hypothetical protein
MEKKQTSVALGGMILKWDVFLVGFFRGFSDPKSLSPSVVLAMQVTSPHSGKDLVPRELRELTKTGTVFR